ncbi:hypothetical protein DFR60_10466 [Hungatella effluvii]|uniref:Uncharacterized protein n=1 Tax=Hungatella effluvii TaxID=1096246 RepID=A0A2V3Y6H7_9FIRM|nr:hypothetical protein [Hungatella effluvii]PXX54241.1 hypothetical protein DFR60_10466 [Hungatella effluvii]
MSKNEQTATMYESIPAVAELNKVPGFNPLKLLRRIVSPENGEAVLQLDLPYKKLWFRLANPKGRIRLNALRITEQMAIYEAQIYLERTDENPIGSFTSSCTTEEAPGGRYIQAAQQMAMDEALSDAGFGIQFADVNMGANGSRYGSRIPLNGTAPDKNVSVSSGTGIVSKESVQPSAAPAGGMVKTFPTAADTGMEKKKTADNRLAVGTAAETKAPPESVAENGSLMAGLPAGMQGGSESLPANPENRTGNLAVQPATEQKMTEQLPAMSTETVKIGEAADRVQMQTENNSLPAGPQTEIQETLQSAGTGELPVKAAEAEGLPVQKSAGLPAAKEPGDVLPASEKNNVEEDTRKAVQGMMALLGGQNIPQKTAAVSTGASRSIENTQIKASASEVQNLPVTEGTVSETQNPSATGGTVSGTQNLPVTGGATPETQNLPAAENQAQGETEARYTPDMPVEEIVKLMTFEEAGQVVVDMGVCKGQTIAEVAERRPPSLKFYLYGGYRGDNNILRAAAQIMLDSLAAKKAG